MENIALGIILSQLIIIPLALKWELDLKTVTPAGLLIGFMAGIGISVLSPWIASDFIWRVSAGVVLVLLFSATILLLRFFRDPVRVPPKRDDCIVSPADGVVKYVKSIDENSVPVSSKGNESVKLAQPFIDILPDRKGYLIGISMSFLDVHVTRAPIPGEMTFCEHKTGSFLSLKKPEAVYRNERVNQVIKNTRVSIGIIQIASRLVRRIVTYVGKGDHLSLGQKIALITFGSQVDVIIPNLEGLQLEVKVGDKVLAGETIISTMAGAHCQERVVSHDKSSLS
ncbi:MAG: phosphatidylserine decarboxylase family protein [Geobacter sp.]|nr:MAG: phosphatidylserine decarboxylase family protein [Geobacter sp.]